MSALKQSVLDEFSFFLSFVCLFLSCFLVSRGERDLVGVVELRIGERVI